MPDATAPHRRCGRRRPAPAIRLLSLTRVAGPVRSAALASACLLATAPHAPTQSEPIPPRDERSTAIFVDQFERADSWPIRALALLSLGSHWHPSGSSALLAALEESDERLLPFAVETLRGTRDDVLRSVSSAELIDRLIRTARTRHPLLRERTLELLRRIADRDELQDRRDVERWWRQAQRDGWTPAEWPPIPTREPSETGTSSGGIVERAFDLRDAGLELMIVIDATGSMQRVIDQAVRALDDIIEVLGSIAPSLRVGIVEYRDFGDMKNGAARVVALHRDTRAAQKELAKVRAYGGGDIPERVEKGLEIALDPASGWRAETNKLVLLVGDAPPHAETETELLAMVRAAHEHPSLAAGRRTGPTTGGAAPGIRPFVVAAISANQIADRTFREIAAAGGGTFAALGRRPQNRGDRGDEPAPPNTSSAEDPAQAIATHVLVDSFGPRFRDVTQAMLAVWFEYRAAALEAGRRR